MDISTNFDLEKKEDHHHHWLLPGSIRCIVVGPSGCGKTNLLLNLLLKKGYLNFDRLHLYSKSLEQSKYQFLREWAEALGEAAGKEVASFHSNSDDIIEVEALDPKERSIMIFDDVLDAKQGPIEKYFTRGRHGGADSFYLTQDYYRIPKQGIRSNVNFLILFDLGDKDMRAIHDTFVRRDMPLREFGQFCMSVGDSYMGLL